MNIVKSNGERAEYDPQKIRRSLKRAGASPKVIDHVVIKVENELREGMTTKELYRIVYRELKDEQRHVAHRYTLRDALLKLGPAGFKFEVYVASVFGAIGWKTEVPPEEFRGKCIHHEIDVVADADGKKVMIEAKFRNDFRNFVELKDTMSTWARYQDLRDGAKQGTCPDFNEVWIVTNGRISSRSKAWGLCKGMEIIGWHYPKKGSFAQLVDSYAMYPITILDTLSRRELDLFSDAGIMLCSEAAEEDRDEMVKKTGISEKRAGHIVQLCKEVVGHE